jgi:hypothetical protein
VPYGFHGLTLQLQATSLSFQIPYRQAINLSTVFTADQPGLYVVGVRLVAGLPQDSNPVTEPSISIHVGPSDSRYLLVISEQIRLRIENASSAIPQWRFKRGRA